MQFKSNDEMCEWLASVGWHSRNDAQWTRVQPLFDYVSGLRRELANELVLHQLAQETLKVVAAERDALRAAVKLCWDALDGIYGGDAFEALPIEVMTPDRRNACNAALEAIGALEI